MTRSERDPLAAPVVTFGDLPDAVRLAARAAASKKAGDLVALDLRHGDAFTDVFLICTAQNVRQARAVADAVEQRLRADLGVRPSHVEGHDRGDWVLLDYFDLVVHVFTPETRAFYGLERLWGRAARVEIVATDLADDRG
ncbi:MAG: ribosome silencing factor [Acidobacteria bacterium]|nr:ribosome silencing factor [Acidobacteriota bacterium]